MDNPFSVKHPFAPGLYSISNCRFLVIQDEMCKRPESDPVHD